MVENEDGLSSGSEGYGDAAPRTDGVVVSLSAHRRWRPRIHFDRASDLVDEARPLNSNDSCKIPPFMLEHRSEMTTVDEPSLWLAGCVALVLLAAIIGLYLACLDAVTVVVALFIEHL